MKREELTGKIFGKLTCIEYLGDRKWLCQCECGKKTAVFTYNLKSGSTISCGCHLASKFIDLLGQRFGRLKVIGYIPPSGRRRGVWKCNCDCGKQTTAATSHLTTGLKQSCGCLRSETTSKRNETHGDSGSRLYVIWQNMKKRCVNPDTEHYEEYGGRGITVCNEWIHDFEAFRKWSLNSGYSDDLTIDRIDNDGNYEPSNCRWATMREQTNNTRRNLRFTYEGETHTLPEWARIKGASYNKIYQRIHTLKWSFERAISEP